MLKFLQRSFLTFLMRDVYCVGYTPRSLQLILDVPLYFWRVVLDP